MGYKTSKEPKQEEEAEGHTEVVEENTKEVEKKSKIFLFRRNKEEKQHDEVKQDECEEEEGETAEELKDEPEIKENKNRSFLPFKKKKKKKKRAFPPFKKKKKKKKK